MWVAKTCVTFKGSGRCAQSTPSRHRGDSGCNTVNCSTVHSDRPPARLASAGVPQPRRGCRPGWGSLCAGATHSQDTVKTFTAAQHFFGRRFFERSVRPECRYAVHTSSKRRPHSSKATKSWHELHSTCGLLKHALHSRGAVAVNSLNS